MKAFIQAEKQISLLNIGWLTQQQFTYGLPQLPSPNLYSGLGPTAILDCFLLGFLVEVLKGRLARGKTTEMAPDISDLSWRTWGHNQAHASPSLGGLDAPRG